MYWHEGKNSQKDVLNHERKAPGPGLQASNGPIYQYSSCCDKQAPFWESILELDTHFY
jgi:hypothetical protein